MSKYAVFMFNITLILGQDGAWNLDSYQLRTATMLKQTANHVPFGEKNMLS